MVRWLTFVCLLAAESGCGPGATPPPQTPPEQPASDRSSAPSDTPADDCTGEIESGPVRAVFEANNPIIQACYEARLAELPTLSGRLDLWVRIGSTGAVDGVHLEGTLDRETMTCIHDVAAAMRFDPPRGGECAVILIPYTFSPR